MLPWFNETDVRFRGEYERLTRRYEKLRNIYKQLIDETDYTRRNLKRKLRLCQVEVERLREILKSNGITS